MNQVARLGARPSEKNSRNLFIASHWICIGLFVGTLALVWLKSILDIPIPGTNGWPEALLVLSAMISTLTALSRQLPGQNVLLGAAIIAVIGGVAQAVGVLTSVPFGPFTYTDNAGPKLFNVLPWEIPFLWILVILTSRGVARLILRPWRKIRAYGFWLMGLTAAFSLLFDLGMEPFATRVKHFWLWHPTRISLDWYGTPITNFVAWLVVVLLILAFATPAMINKKPATKSPPDFHPLVVWVLFNLLFLSGAVVHQFWLAAGLTGAASVAATAFSIRGARW